MLKSLATSAGTGLACALLAAQMLAAPALAEEAPGTSPLSALYACQALVGSAEKLSCFERETAALQARESGREVVVIDEAQAVELKKESFGFSLPSLPKLKLPSLGGGDGPEEVRLPVKSVRKVGRDYVVEMQNGQVWRQIGGDINRVPRGDLEAIIEEAALGSYRLRLSNGKGRSKALRVRRVR